MNESIVDMRRDFVVKVMHTHVPPGAGFSKDIERMNGDQAGVKTRVHFSPLQRVHGVYKQTEHTVSGSTGNPP